MCKLMNKQLGFIFFALQHVYFDLRYVAVHPLGRNAVQRDDALGPQCYPLVEIYGKGKMKEHIF